MYGVETSLTISCMFASATLPIEQAAMELAV
jgi:hypothetical protein